MNNLLYFPYISLPNSQWLIQNLLYWDKIGSIVPIDYLENPDLYDSYMKELVQEELVEQISPAYHISKIEKFSENFIKYIDSDPYFLNHNNNQNIVGNRSLSSMIHIEKLDDIGTELVRRNLARKEKSSRWYKVESYTANLFMTYLATSIGRITDYTPSTDKYEGLSLLTTKPTKNHTSRYNKKRDVIRTKIFKEIMPVPSHVDNVYDIIEFKNKYKNELSRYRNYIESVIMDLEIAPDDQQKDRWDRFIEKSNDEKHQIEKMINGFFTDKKINYVSIFPVFASVGGIAAGVATANPLAIYLSSLGLTGSLLSSAKKNDYTNKPLAYALLAGKKFN